MKEGKAAKVVAGRTSYNSYLRVFHILKEFLGSIPPRAPAPPPSPHPPARSWINARWLGYIMRDNTHHPYTLDKKSHQFIYQLLYLYFNRQHNLTLPTYSLLSVWEDLYASKEEYVSKPMYNMDYRNHRTYTGSTVMYTWQW